MSSRTFKNPQTGEIYDLSNPTMKGFLTKQSVWIKDWRRRYFVLKGSKLFFSTNETSEPHGMIDLSICMTVKSAHIKTGQKHALEIATDDTVYFMYADTEKEKDEWIGAVGRAIVQSSSTFQRDDGTDDQNSDDDD